MFDEENDTLSDAFYAFNQLFEAENDYSKPEGIDYKGATDEEVKAAISEVEAAISEVDSYSSSESCEGLENSVEASQSDVERALKEAGL